MKEPKTTLCDKCVHRFINRDGTKICGVTHDNARGVDRCHIYRCVREDILGEAKECVTKARNQAYGAPEDNFSAIARLWSEYTGNEITAAQVGMMLILLKVARQKHDPAHHDNYVDIAGYAACVGEIAGKE